MQIVVALMALTACVLIAVWADPKCALWLAHRLWSRALALHAARQSYASVLEECRTYVLRADLGREGGEDQQDLGCQPSLVVALRVNGHGNTTAAARSKKIVPERRVRQ